MMFAKFLVVMFTVTGFASIELGPEFWLAVNTMLNLVTLIYVQTQHKRVRDIEPKVQHVEDVAAQLDTRVAGGRRDYDPCEDGDTK